MNTLGGILHKHHWKLSMKDLQEPEKTQLIYNVLGINCEGEVAYCKGCGEVDRFIWDKVVGEAETAISLG